MRSRARLPGAILTAIGSVALLCAGFGFLYNAESLAVAFRGGFERQVAEHDLRSFYPAFYVMSAFCIVFYVVLFWCGLRLLGRRANAAWPFSVLMVVEVLYFLTVASFAPFADDLSVAGAFGVANGGLMAQGVILLPLWGPPSALWASRRIASNASADRDADV